MTGALRKNRQQITLRRSGLGDAIAPGKRVGVKLGMIQNPAELTTAWCHSRDTGAFWAVEKQPFLNLQRDRKVWTGDLWKTKLWLTDGSKERIAIYREPKPVKNDSCLKR